jgi:carbon storage regulator CsrA
MLILTRREGETIHIGEEIVAKIVSIMRNRVCIDLVVNDGHPVSLGETRLEHSGFVRRYVKRGEHFNIGDNIQLIVCNKDRTPSQVAIGIAAPKEVVILRGELYQRQQRDKGRAAA